MSIYLIDIENVNLELFLKSKNFEKTDKFYLVGNSNLKFSMFVLEFFEDVKYKIYHFNSADKNYADKNYADKNYADKNYADKILFTILGSILNRPKYVNDKIYMVSNDSIFSSLKYTKKLFNKNVENIKFNNSTSLVPEKKKDLIVVKDTIDNLYRINKEKIKKILIKTDKNSDFHNGLVKEFGKDDGIELYRFIKNYDSGFDPMIFYVQKRLDIDIIIQAHKDEKDIKYFLVDKFFNDGEKLFEFLKGINFIDNTVQKSKEEDFYNKHKIEIENIKKSSNNMSEFHNALVKKYGMEIGKHIYKFIKNM
ncbi:hypothetical protein [Campylobacter ureolyticus]|uniref:PIN-like domain-containing protein n=1 Tax=Campylobacter ureolyticus TaxID=827 RepID=A0A9Q4PVL8_9BACT|nr:hypothetical protein [Campylobacter ureolyticus]MCZ6162039.1 hypothetical protein [Campylobacter ureolyticus]